MLNADKAWKKKVKDFAGDVKENMAGNIEELKKEVVAAIESASDGKVRAQDIKKKFDDFKESQLVGLPVISKKAGTRSIV